ncbi:hypothetical protein ACGFIE_00260 [Micromonospora sp. NPDC049275]|uniref:hypothetical protein n=1 Tax=Micromonospora sp. NPDC049275 TaxID=3364268 RepID=UPI00371B2533
MTTDVLLAMHANRYGRAFPAARHRHVHVSKRPFVVVGYHLPGDPSAPIGVMFGDNPDRPGFTYAVEPTRWRNKIDSMEGFARSLNRYIAGAIQGNNGAPQLLLANQAAVEWLCGDIGRYWRGLDADGQWGAGPSIPIAGAHLSYFAGANRVPGSSAVLPLADVLTLHWATGRLATLDRRLGVALAWIQRPDDIAAAEAELSDGPVPDATWEQQEYLVSLRAYERHKGPDRQLAMKIIDGAVRSALEPTWCHAWQAHELLYGMSEAETVAERWERDLARFRLHAERLRADQARFRSILPLLDAYNHIDRVERMTAELHHAMAFDDDIIMAAHVARGAALSGIVTARNGRTLAIRPDLPFERAAGTRLWWRTRATIKNRERHVFVELRVRAGLTNDLVELDVVRGAATSATRNRLPAVGTHIVCPPFGGPKFIRRSMPDELPWTHLPAGVTP